MTLTIEQLRHSIYQETGIGFGPRMGVYSSTLRTAGAITIPSLTNSDWTGSETGQLWIFLPKIDTDRERPAGSLVPTTGVVTNAGEDWATTAVGVEQVELVKYISPSELFEQIAGTFHGMSQTVLHPLGTFEDSDCEADNEDSWTDDDATLAKVTAAGLVHSGRRAIQVTATADGGNAQGQPVAVNPRGQVYASATFRAVTGSGYFQIWDVTNDRVIVESRAYDGTRFVHIPLRATVPAGCEEVEIRACATSSGDVVVFDHFGGPFIEGGADLNLLAPSWLTEPWRFRKLREARYGADIGNQIYDARSRRFEDWALREEVAFNVMPSDVHPYVLQLRDRRASRDLWIEGQRRSIDLLSNTLDENDAAAETITTTLPDEEVILEASLAVCDYIISRDPTNLEIKVNGGRIAAKRDAVRSSKEIELAPQRQEYYPYAIGRRV